MKRRRKIILIDFSQVFRAVFFAVYGEKRFNEFEPDMMKTAVMHSVAKLNSKFRKEYGDLVLAIDTKKSWRKELNPYYKARRSTSRKESKVDWKSVFAVCDELIAEIKEIFPYRVIEIDRAEGDDIIGALALRNIVNGEKTLVVSRDEDFVQLQIDTELIKQWDPIYEKWIGNEDPKRFLFEHVLAGDSADDIPNILSPLDCFVTKTRQTPMRQTKINAFLDNPGLIRNDPVLFERLQMNIQLIDLKYIPVELRDQIYEAYDNYIVNDRSKLYGYFVERGMQTLAKRLGDF